MTAKGVAEPLTAAKRRRRNGEQKRPARATLVHTPCMGALDPNPNNQNVGKINFSISTSFANDINHYIYINIFFLPIFLYSLPINRLLYYSLASLILSESFFFCT